MTKHRFCAYVPSALDYNSRTGTVRLSASYNHSADRIAVAILDDGGCLHGDGAPDTSGNDPSKTAVVTGLDGVAIATGRLTEGAFATVLDGSTGKAVRLEWIEIEGIRLGCSASRPLVPGQSYPVMASAEASSAGPDSRLPCDRIQAFSCFGPGTMIATQAGELPVEWLAPGDRVLTLDHGYQPVLWVGRSPVDAGMVARGFDAVEIAGETCGGSAPRHPLRLTPCHRVLLNGPDLGLHFGESEVLAAAQHLVGGDGIARVPVEAGQQFHQVLLPEHEVILAEGLWVESLFAASRMIAMLPPGQRWRIEAMTAGGHARTARMCLKAQEVALLQNRRVRTDRAAA
ncbi:MAG: Hint domain-containing protein [Paracoccaceae bacterium]